MTDDLPSFLKIPERPRPSSAQSELLDAIERREIYRLWVKAGVISRAPRPRGLSISELIGLFSIVGAMAFALGYWIGFR